MLARIMKKADPDLWLEANLTGPFGCKSFRQLAVKDIFRSGKDVEEKLRSIGLTLKTARRYYEHPNSLSHVREQDVMGRPGPSGVQRPTRKATKVQDFDPESDSESDSDSDRVAREAADENLARRLQMKEDSDGDRSPGLSDDDTHEEAARNRKKKDDEESTTKTPKHKGVGKKSSSPGK